MSLSTNVGGGMGGAGAGAGAGGMVMAHQANAMAQAQAAQPPPQANEIPGATGPSSMPMTNAALAADLVDKNQLTSKQVRGVSHLPIVAIDMYAQDAPVVASFPPKLKPEQSEGANALVPSVVGKVKPHVCFKKGEVPHRTLRKFLTQDKGYESLLTDSLATSGDSNVVVIEKPHQWLGTRRLTEVPSLIKEGNSGIVHEGASTAKTTKTSAAIAEEAFEGGLQITNGTLDGISAPTGDDFDRVVYKIRLAETKKALTMLPEEATKLVLAVAQTAVARKNPSVKNEDDDVLDFPIALPLPSWACTDVSLEGWMDCTTGGVFVQRSMAALAGALLISPEGQPSEIFKQVVAAVEAMQAAHQKKNDGTPFTYDPLVVLVGLANDGVECTAVQLSEFQSSIASCLIGNYKVLANVAHPCSNPMSKVEDCIRDLYLKLDEVAPEIESPVGLVTYGTSTKEQNAVKSKLETVRNDLETWEKVPVLGTKVDAVSLGAAVLGGVSHGRVFTFTEGKGTKPKPQLAIRIQDVAPTAAGIRMSYREGQWGPVKIIFDFDRRVPAGPFDIDLNAAECAAKRSATSKLSDEDLLKAIASNEGAKGIPKREEAALDFRIQMVQKSSRDGEWLNVGNPERPLTKLDPNSDDEEQVVACERVILELSLGSTGIITQDFVGELETVRQATVSARNSTLKYWLGVLAAILFFGGFLFKSYWEEYVFERDTKRLLAFYKNIAPNSLADGDEHNARYLVYKYRGRKAKLWKRLETKYGHPVLDIGEWPEEEEEENKDEQHEEENLDEEKANQGDESREEPDL